VTEFSRAWFGVAQKSVFIRVDPWFNFCVSQTMEAVSQLCPACGLCCNGVLFGDVELQSNDDAKHLKELGLALSRKGRKQCFRQPCSCFDGQWCRVYEDRPHRCREFECGLLKRVLAGTVNVPAALKSIAQARKAADDVRNIVRELGDTNEHLPLNRRYSAIVAKPIDLAGDDATIERRSEMMLKVAKLTQILERDFLVPSKLSVES
jgi:hypothetical protein